MNNTEKTQEATLKLEREIKALILLSVLYLKSRTLLKIEINNLIEKYSKELPGNLIDKNKYIEGAFYTSTLMIKNYYEPLIWHFEPEEVYQKPIDFIKNAYKGQPTNEYYVDLIKKAVRGLNKQELVYSEKGKKPITLWQKVELDIRHEAQMKMVEEAYKSNKDLFWLSSHANCSKRCQKDQGKLVSLTLKSIDNSFFTGKIVDGIRVYSFTDIENQVDKYGYKNNIINGFNCRHKLIPYEKNGYVPKHYSSEGIKQVQSKENIQREMERAIRRKKGELELVKYIDKEQAKKLRITIQTLKAQYKAFCEKYGLVREDYRIS